MNGVLTTGLSRAAIAIVVATMAGACDSNEEDAGPEILGLWEVTTFRDGSGDLTAVLDQAFNIVSFEFRGDGGFIWFQDGINDQDDDTIAGSFTLTETGEDTGDIRVTLQDNGFSVQMNFTLTVLGPNRIRLMIDADAFNEINGTGFSGTMSLTFERI